MARSHKKTRQRSKAAPPPDPQEGRRAFLRHLRNGVIGAAVLGGGGFIAVGHVSALAAEHDLSQIGNGIPTIVQVHDPQCPLCRDLQRETRAALKAFDDDALQYLVANIQLDEGRAFARRHGVEHVTLVLLNGDGDRLGVIAGTTPRDTLRVAFQDHLTALSRR